MEIQKKRYGILDRIQSTEDLRGMSYPVLEELCASLREFLIDHVAKTGGHLASNLGIVELAVALEREFNSQEDRIIYDVGHQSYVHKILTGRKAQFDTLRTYGGLSGFMKPEESKTDPCITGHASSSVSVALGMAHARTLRAKKYHVVAVIGDGALTGGMAYEALNNAGDSGEPLLVVLNDNNMSITQNVGAMSRHLAKLRVSPRYQTMKNHVRNVLSHVPGGKTVARWITKTKAGIKNMVLSNSLFEQMGFAYLGPVDGHDLKSVCELIRHAKSLKKPVLLHVVTQKGRGYPYAEQNPGKFHGVSAFDPLTGDALAAKTADFSACFGETLTALAEKDERICAITAAMSSGTGLTQFSVQYPQRFFDVGIAEEHAVAMSAGMAKQGLKPVCALYSTFLQRAYDQIIHDAAIEGLPIVLGVDRAGIVGADGATHNGVFDVAFLRQIPGVTVYAPSSFAELRTMLSNAIYHSNGPAAIRYPRGGEGAYRENTAAQAVIRLREGHDIVIVSYGILINEALQAAEKLHKKGIQAAVYKVNTLTAWDDATMLQEIMTCGRLIVAEDCVQSGSIGESISMALTMRGAAMKQVILRNTGDRFLPHGSVKQLWNLCKIDADGIVSAAQEEVESE